MPKPRVQCDGPGVDAWGNPVEAEQCKNTVMQTKPSASGFHYCAAPTCQAARARNYQRSKAKQSRAQVRRWELLFLHDAANKTRVPCPACGLENAIPGWSHRAADASPCRELSADIEGRGVAVELIDAVWPHPVHAGAIL